MLCVAAADVRTPSGHQFADIDGGQAGQAHPDTRQHQPWIARLQQHRRQQRSASATSDHPFEAIVAGGDHELLEGARVVLALPIYRFGDSLHALTQALSGKIR